MYTSVSFVSPPHVAQQTTANLIGKVDDLMNSIFPAVVGHGGRGVRAAADAAG
jgi:hypothetical protein